MSQITEQDIQRELDDLRDRFPKLKNDELFVAWFVACFITDTEDQAVASLVGGARDKGLDAVHIDDASRKVFLVQGKYREKLEGGTEKRADVLALANLAGSLTDSEEFKEFRKGLGAAATARVDEARRRIEKHGYRLQLYFLTTGRVTESLYDESRKCVRRHSSEADLEVFDGRKVVHLLSDYLDGVAPPVPMLEFELENGAGISTTSVLQRFDKEARISSWVVPVAVSQIADLFSSVGVRLFARNVRGYLGNTEINRNLKHTLEHEPEFFWYFNNGITIVCDGAEKVSRNGKEILRLVNPQIINGQQTTRTLHECASTGVKAAVMVRVISLPRETEEETHRFEKLVSKIVSATNWQNRISASDIMSNDRLQIQLERNLRKLGYQYLRKRQSKGEARRLTGGIARFQITKEELAQVSSACELDPLVPRRGKEHLFGEDLYTSVFPHADAEHYIGQYHLALIIKTQARGFPERAYMKWLVVHFLWKRLGPLLAKRTRRRAFIRMAERREIQQLPKAIDAVFKSVSAYYRETSGVGEARQDVSTFFLKKGHHREFEKFWKAADMGHMRVFERAWSAFTGELEEAEERP